MQRLANTILSGILGLGLSAALLNCGGSDGPEAKVAPAVEKPAEDVDAKKAAAQAAKVKKAEKLYGKLSLRLEKLPPEKPIDPKWLEGELKKVLKISPDHLGARFSMAALRHIAGDEEGARKEYEAIADANPEFAPASENIAAEMVGAGDIDGARAIYKGFADRDPKNTTSRLGLARLHLAEGQYKPAIELCRKVLQRRGNAIEAFRVLALAYKATGNIPMTELVIGRGLKLDKKDPELHYLLAQLYFERDDLSQGVDKLKEVIAMKPQWLKVRAHFAEIALKYRDFGNASQQYDAILKQSKNHRASMVGLAVSYKGMGRFEQAEKLYKDLLGKNAKDADALWNIAVLYHRHLSKYDDAIKHYKLYEGVAKEGDKKAERVAALVKKVTATKNDLAAQKDRLEREAKKKASIEAACGAVAKGKPAGKLAEAIGNEQERIEVAWQLMVDGQGNLEQGNLEAGEEAVQCAFGIIPDSPNAKTSACAPMKVMWTQLLYQLGRLPDAIKTIDEALVCDPENPDAQLIQQQLVELASQAAAEAEAQAAEAAAAAQAGAGLDAGGPQPAGGAGAAPGGTPVPKGKAK